VSGLFGSIWWLIVSIGILVTFHEFGHFIVARFFGVHVLRFSVGFGRPLFKRVDGDGTEFVISAIPLGGYVKMLDEREFVVDPADAHRAHNRKPVWQRMAIALAGPVANFILCFVLFWTMFVIGLPDYAPVVGEASGLAAQAGFQSGDRLRSIDGETVETWTDAGMLLASVAMDRKPVRIEVTRPDGGVAMRNLALEQLPRGLDDREALGQVGLFPKQLELPADLPPVIGQIAGDGPNGLLFIGDRVLAVDGAPIRYFSDILPRVKADAHEGAPLHLTVQRDGRRLQVDVVPRSFDAGNGKRALLIGIGPPEVTAPYDALRRYGPVAAFGASALEMKRETTATFGLLKRIFTEGAVQEFSGVVGIARTANAAARQGLAWFLFFLAMLSLSLGIINLLPVPILDGGHLLYYLIELVKGSPVSERSLAIGQYIGLALLGGLMCVAFYNDLLRHAS
jgi:regulator of sigma E protease